jgi:hypothetical protein
LWVRDAGFERVGVDGVATLDAEGANTAVHVH